MTVLYRSVTRRSIDAVETPAEVWRRADVREALAAQNFGALLRSWRKWTGTSQTKAAALCDLAQSDVSQIERGRRLVTSAAVQQRILDGLSVPAGLRPVVVGSAPIPSAGAQPDTELAARVGATVEHDQLDRPVLDYLERTLAEHRRIEDQLGAKALLPVVTAQSDILGRLVRFAPSPLHDEALSLAAQYSQFEAWMWHDQQQDDKALALFGLAESQAQEAGDPTMAAHVLSLKAHLAWGAGNPLACVRYAEAAQWAGHRITPAAQGMAAQMEARGLAILKDADGTDRKVEEAERLLERASQHWEDEPPWLYFYEGPWMRLQVGALQLDLGRYARAVELLTAALSELDPAYVRDAAWYRAILARAELEAGDAERAVSTALAVLPDAKATNAFALDHIRHTVRKMERRTTKTVGMSELSRAVVQ